MALVWASIAEMVGAAAKFRLSIELAPWINEPAPDSDDAAVTVPLLFSVPVILAVPLAVTVAELVSVPLTISAVADVSTALLVLFPLIVTLGIVSVPAKVFDAPLKV